MATLAQRTERATVFNLESDARSTLFAVPTMPANFPDKKIADAVNDYIALYLGFDSERKHRRNDPGARPEDVEAWEQGRKAAIRAVSPIVHAPINKLRATKEAARAALLSPPEPNSDALRVDQEIRSAVAAMSPEESAALFRQLGEGKHARTLLALARDPVPLRASGERGKALFATLRAVEIAAQLEPIDAEIASINDVAETSVRAVDAKLV